MKWSEAKKLGLCVKCCKNKAEGKNMIHCAICSNYLKKEMEKEDAAVKYYRDYNNDRG